MRQKLRLVLIVICLGVMIYSGTMIVKELNDYRRGDQAYQALEVYVTLPGQDAVTQAQSGGELESEGTNPSEKPTETGNLTLWPSVDFDALKQINNHLKGWLYCPDTVINYPVVQCQNNDYYLNHRFDGESHKSGCLFVDASNLEPFTDWNTIIYGHHMKNDSMFGTLTEYKMQDYYDAHPVFLYLSDTSKWRIKLFAGYVSPPDGDAWRVTFADEAERMDWISRAIDRSTFVSGVVPGPEDKIVTLSTCSYEYDNARYVLLGIAERCEEPPAPSEAAE